MADTKTSALTALTGAGTADGDQLPIVDTSTSTLKRIDASELSVYIDGKLVPYKVGGTDVAVTDGGTGASTASDARTNLGLVIGTDVQAYDADLAALAAISGVQGDVIYHNGTSWTRLGAGTSGQFLKTQGAGANPSWATASGGGGSVATDTIFDAKGDLPVGTGADTAAKLAVGTDGQSIEADSTQSTGIKWSNRKPFTPVSAPTDISGCVVWLDASHAGSFTFSSGVVVSQWTSRDAGAKAFTEGTATNQPSRNGTLNGLSTVVFDGTNDILTWTGTLTGGTVFAVYSISGTTGTHALGGINSKRLFQHNVGTDYTSSSDWPTDPRYVDGRPFPIITSGVLGYFNARPILSSARASSTSSLTNMTLGFQSPNTVYAAVTIAEVIIYDTVLTRRNMERVEQYLREKWDV